MAYASQTWTKDLLGQTLKKAKDEGLLGGGSSGENIKDVYSRKTRWLRFNPINKKGLIVLGGTKIRLSDGSYYTFENDTPVDFSSENLEAGKDYFVYLDNSGNFSCSLDNTITTSLKIGRFHTLCVDVGDNLTMNVPASPNSELTAGDNYLVKSYRQDEDFDFYEFYNKQIISVAVNGTHYDTVTCYHPLKGYKAGEILPESIFCITFKPKTLFDDAMVYDKNTDLFVDVYLQSGTGMNTRSVYNAKHTTSRTAANHLSDMHLVGKRPLLDNEFISIALGSNEKTNIVGSSDKTYVGGHSDTAGRRMISAIGCEECCGYLWQWLSNVGFNGQSSVKTTDGIGNFGNEYGAPYILMAGGRWANSTSCGSRARGCLNFRSTVSSDIGCRGSVLYK